MSVLFLSDIHLAPERPLITAVFESFLTGPARLAEQIFILGDLFEYWAGDDDLDDPFNRRIVSAIRSCAAHTQVHFMRGNRDFLIGDDFASASRTTLIDDPLVMDLFGTRTLIMHGDSLCTDDLAYQEFRTLVRSRDWTANFLTKPLVDRKGQIQALRARSEAEKLVKSSMIMDVNASATIESMRRYRCSRLIHGHTHRRAVHRFYLDGVPAERWVLGDWYSDGNYLECSADGLKTSRLPTA